MVVDGTNLITASVENGHAVVRRFDMTSGTPVLTSTRDLGDLQGGDIAGLALDGGEVVIAGSTSNPALSAGTVTRGACRRRRRLRGAALLDARARAPATRSPITRNGRRQGDLAGGVRRQGVDRRLAGTDLPGQAAVGTRGRLPDQPGRRGRHHRLVAPVHRQGRAGGPDRHRPSRRPGPACWTGWVCRRERWTCRTRRRSPPPARCGRATSSPSRSMTAGPPQ